LIEIGQIVLENISINNFQCIHDLPFRDECFPLLVMNKPEPPTPFRMIVPTLVKVGPVVLGKIFKDQTLLPLLSPFYKSMVLHFNKPDIPSPKFDCNWSDDSGEDF
jgi:hypothetical protein